MSLFITINCVSVACVHNYFTVIYLSAHKSRFCVLRERKMFKKRLAIYCPNNKYLMFPWLVIK